MRTNLLSGLLLTAAAVITVAVSAAFDLELESVALLGVAAGAVVALVPDRGPGVRLGGFLLGFAITFVGYGIRVELVPDTSAGHAVVVGLVMGACALVTVSTRARLPLWSLLLGAAAVAGGYEFTYAAAPPELPDTASSTATMLLITVGVGFVAASLASPAVGSGPPEKQQTQPADDSDLDDALEVTA